MLSLLRDRQRNTISMDVAKRERSGVEVVVMGADEATHEIAASCGWKLRSTVVGWEGGFWFRNFGFRVCF